jgi:hypothetical protein
LYCSDHENGEIRSNRNTALYSKAPLIDPENVTTDGECERKGKAVQVKKELERDLVDVNWLRLRRTCLHIIAKKTWRIEFFVVCRFTSVCVNNIFYS